jgi:hypothetical protein
MTQQPTDYSKIGVGTKENQKLKPAKVKILGVSIQTNKKDGTELKSPIAHILCKHPDREETVELTKIKFEKNGKLDVVTLWVSLDDEGKFSKSSALAELLRFTKSETLNDLTGKEVDTMEQSKEDTYLCIKAY